ncbi:hypothetical protein SAMN04244553_2844 [Nocardia amikacinitolerans]|uniref:DUF8020 domain-containing protein n=2 Tax=Nocardia amikacinitolerans TaxID=756689 RepID=A0A285LB51_9NOCA|nr:hypothetical protein SAMN04244553_2844 [Nocardia amikacinitolerans]
MISMLHRAAMRVGRKALIGALPLVVATTFAGAGAASADSHADQQARLASAISTSESAGELGFRTTVAPDLSTVSATLDAGTFQLGETSIKVVDKAGAAVSELPLELAMPSGAKIALDAEVSDGGRALSVKTPEVSAATGVELKDIATNPHAQYPDPVMNGAAAGAGAGAVLALITCIPTVAAFVVGYIACAAVWGVSTAVIGAIIGALVGTAMPDVIPQVLP